MSKIVLLLVSWLSVLALTGCQPQSARITSLQRKAAASLISEAEFALTIREFVRAEKLLTQASALEFDNGKTWISLGMVRVRLAGSRRQKPLMNPRSKPTKRLTRWSPSRRNFISSRFTCSRCWGASPKPAAC